MPSVTLKNVPDELLEALRNAAAAERRSLNQEILYLLTAALRDRGSPVSVAAIEAQVAAWRALAGSWKSEGDAESEAREIMDRRTPGREVDW